MENSGYSFIDSEKLLEILISYASSTLGAIAVLVIGFWLSRAFSRYIYAVMLKRGLDPAIRSFVKSVLKVSLNIFVVLIAINTIGIKITSILAVIGGAALGVGMGLQGGLSNFAAGVMIIITKPFRIGDLIETHGHIGYVEKISLLNTTICSPRNELVILPNAPLFNNSLSNYTSKNFYRIDITVGLEYKSDIKRLKPLITEAIKKDTLFSPTKPITVEIEQFAEDRLNLTIRAFTKPSNYFHGPLRLREITNETMQENGFTIPTAQRHIQIISKKEA